MLFLLPYWMYKNIPYSLGLRNVRICTNPEVKDIRLNDLKNLLLSRNYPERLVDSALDKARQVPRHASLKRVIRKKRKKIRPIFALKFDPRLPSIINIQARHWRSMTHQDNYLAEE